MAIFPIGFIIAVRCYFIRMLMGDGLKLVAGNKT